MKLINWFKKKFIPVDKYIVRNYGPNRAERRAEASEASKHKPNPIHDKHAETKNRGYEKWQRLVSRLDVDVKQERSK